MFFAILTLFASLAVAAVAGWFSIVGVMAIYAGAPMHAALIMGMVLEGAKLMTTSWLYRNWTHSTWLLKLPLIYFMIALMVATSIGVFGFLTKSHLEQGAATIDNSAKVERLDQQIEREKSVIADDEKMITQLDTAVNSYIGKDKTDKAVAIRKSQGPQRKQLRDDIDASQKRIDEFNDTKLKLQSEVRALQLEVGPIKYIAGLFYGDDTSDTKKIESAVKMFTLLIVSTLDPLAIILLIAANHTILRHKNEKEIKDKSTTYNSGSIQFVADAHQPSPTTTPKDNEEIANESLLGAIIEAPLPTIDDTNGIGSIEDSHMAEAAVYDQVPEEIPKADSESVVTWISHSDEEETPLEEAQNSNLGDRDIQPEQRSELLEEKNENTESDEFGREASVSPIEDMPLYEEKENTVENGSGSPVDSNVHEETGDNQASHPESIERNDHETPEEVVVTSTQPWAQQADVLRNLMDSMPHFVPKPIDEMNTTPPILNEPGKVETVDKYPKTLSWIKEFKKA